MMDIHTYLPQGEPLLFGGVMGICFAAYPGRAEKRCERANPTRPKEILHIRCVYLQVGYRVIKINTLAISGDLFDGSDEAICDTVSATCHLARQVARPYGAYVFADLGPAPRNRSRAPIDLYQTQAQWLLEQGVTHFLAEMLSGDEGLPELAGWLEEKSPNAFLMVSFAVDHSGTTSAGYLGSELYRFASKLAGVDAVGFNCVFGSRHLLKYTQTLELSGEPLAVISSTNYPTAPGRRTVFGGQPDHFTGQIAQIIQAGAPIVGGCCGTTPEHVAQTAQVLKEPLPKRTISALKKLLKPVTGASNSLREKSETGKYVIAVELDPPVDDDSVGSWEGMQALRGSGAGAATITGHPIDRPRADSNLLACKIKRDIDIEPLPHMTCRGRNLNTTGALLLGLPMEGVHNVLAITGDPIPAEDRNEVRSVFNFSSRKLTRFVRTLNENILHAPFRIYGALNLNARNFDVGLWRAQEKEACGASDFLTQPVLSTEALDNLKLAYKTLRGKALGRIFPVVDRRNACFLNNEIPGIQVCDKATHLYERKDRDAVRVLAVTVSAAIAKEIFLYTDDHYLMTPFRRVVLTERIIQSIQQSCIP